MIPTPKRSESKPTPTHWIISLFALVLSLRAGEPLSETAVIHRPQDLKLETSNLVHNLGLGLAYQKTFW